MFMYWIPEEKERGGFVVRVSVFKPSLYKESYCLAACEVEGLYLGKVKPVAGIHTAFGFFLPSVHIVAFVIPTPKTVGSVGGWPAAHPSRY